MQAINPEDQKLVLVGRPVPFSIYSADKTLLLAAGREVPNEFVRESLLRSGKFRGTEGGELETAAAANGAASDPIASLQAAYQHTLARAPVGFRMERDNGTLNVRVIGVSDDGHGLIMGWPTSSEGPAAVLHEGETWTFRALYAVAAIRFHGVIEKIVSSPFPYFSVSNISDIDRRDVRQWPRAPACLWASRAGEPPRIIVDLSVGGARIAVDDRTHLQQGQVLSLSTSVTLCLGRKDLSLDARILNNYGRSDSEHPGVTFHGVRFENLIESQQLAVHAFVQEQLCMALDRVWHVLTFGR